MQQVLSQSLNTGVAFVTKRMGNETFREYMLKFGLGERTGIDLPNEAAGLVNNIYSPRDLEYATASFGQGIAMSPIATVRALSALANKGVLPNPRLLNSIEYTSGVSKKPAALSTNQVISNATADEISRMLVRVVDEELSGGDVKLPNHTVAAKTGTAQIPDLVNGGYRDDVYLHSFFGYFPAYDARYLIFLMADKPNRKYASQTLTSPFIDLTKFLINYYEIPPDR